MQPRSTQTAPSRVATPSPPPRRTAGFDRDLAALMHGPTFMANPLACAVARASVDLLCASPWAERVGLIAAQLAAELEPARRTARLADVRVLGAIGLVEMHHPVDVRAAQRHFVDRGVWVRPFGRLVYVMPPFVIEEHDLRRLTDAVVAFVTAP